jgi:glucose/arabinose dehydrogenase
MRTYLWMTAALSVVACSDSKPPQEDEGTDRTGEQNEVGLDASAADSTTRDAAPSRMDASSASDAADRADASLPADDSSVDASSDDASTDDASADDASSVEVDASTDDASFDDAGVAEDAAATVDAIITLPEDAGLQEDAGMPPPACDATAAPVVGKLGLQAIISGQGLSSLTEAHQPPGSDDWYLVQQNGLIRVLQNGVLRPTPFLDLSAEITLFNAPVYEDRGLVSIEFAPDYATSGRFYVSVTANRGPDENLDQIRSYVRAAGDPYVADVATRQDILSLAGSHVNALSDYTTNIHNGGRITFGPDGMLYLAMGDGGGINCGDSEPNAQQDVNTLFGKLLRLDLSKPPPYAADDNPFVQGGDPRVLHYGLRNPFRYSFDRLTGDLYIGDVGQNTYEEISFAPAGSKGLNFGWAHFEGPSNDTCGAFRPLRPGSVHTPPIVSVERNAFANNPFADYNAMIGGVVYRGSALPQLQGIYFFGGYAGARLGALRQCGSTTSLPTPVAKRCNANSPSEACLRSLNGAPAFSELRAIVEDHAGEMYMVANGNTLFKVVPLP